MALQLRHGLGEILCLLREQAKLETQQKQTNTRRALDSNDSVEKKKKGEEITSWFSSISLSSFLISPLSLSNCFKESFNSSTSLWLDSTVWDSSERVAAKKGNTHTHTHKGGGEVRRGRISQEGKINHNTHSLGR